MHRKDCIGFKSKKASIEFIYWNSCGSACLSNMKSTRTDTDLRKQKPETETDGLLEEKDNLQRTGFFHKFKGVIAAFGAVLFYVSSGTSVQLLNRRIPDFELNTIRSVI